MSIDELSAYAGAAVREAMRPKASGRLLDAHTSKFRREPEPDLERMKRAVSGKTKISEHDEPMDDREGS